MCGNNLLKILIKEVTIILPKIMSIFLLHKTNIRDLLIKIFLFIDKLMILNFDWTKKLREKGCRVGVERRVKIQWSINDPIVQTILEFKEWITLSQKWLTQIAL